MHTPMHPELFAIILAVQAMDRLAAAQSWLDRHQQRADHAPREERVAKLLLDYEHVLREHGIPVTDALLTTIRNTKIPRAALEAKADALPHRFIWDLRHGRIEDAPEPVQPPAQSTEADPLAVHDLVHRRPESLSDRGFYQDYIIHRNPWNES